MSLKNRSRILRDKKMILQDPLIGDNIIVLHDEEDIYISRACIIGPKDTPYEDGFYFFEFRFPENYPFEPLKVSYFTNDGKTRMHPNFYVCGKVCLSIIGTWSGPGWTSCQTLSSVLLTIQSLFIANPLHQEPGFEDNYTLKNTNYNQIIHHQNLKTSIIQMYQDIPSRFQDFYPILTQYLCKNQESILSKLLDNTPKDNKVIDSIWNFKIKTNYKDLRRKLNEIYQDIIEPLPECQVDKWTHSFKKCEKLSLKELNNILTSDYPVYDSQVISNILQIKGIIRIQGGNVSLVS